MKTTDIEEIKMLLSVVNEQVERFFNRDTEVPRIEMDIVKENLRKLYERIDSINMSAPRHIDQSHDFESDVLSEIDNEAGELIEMAEEQFEENNNIAGRDQNMTLPFDETVEEIDGKDDKKGENSVRVDNAAPVPKEKPSADKKRKSVHQLATEKSSEKTLGENIVAKKISSLRKSISINDKFQIRNELFDGKASAYSDAIDKFDGFTTFEQAKEYFGVLAMKYQWDFESEIVELFLNYLKRRY